MKFKLLLSNKARLDSAPSHSTVSVSTLQSANAAAMSINSIDVNSPSNTSRASSSPAPSLSPIRPLSPLPAPTGGHALCVHYNRNTGCEQTSSEEISNFIGRNSSYLFILQGRWRTVTEELVLRRRQPSLLTSPLVDQVKGRSHTPLCRAYYALQYSTSHLRVSCSVLCCPLLASHPTIRHWPTHLPTLLCPNVTHRYK